MFKIRGNIHYSPNISLKKVYNTHVIGFFTDLDNTLIYSYKHDIGTDKECVEIYNDREISFSTKNTLKLIKDHCTMWRRSIK